MMRKWTLFLSLILFTKVQFYKRNHNGDYNFNFYQNEYSIRIERMVTAYYDETFLKYFKILTFKYNRTCTAFNLTFQLVTADLENVHVVIQAYRFASNEYRLFPLRFQYNYCNAMFKDFFGYSRQFHCGNLTDCKVEKGKTYRVCNWILDDTKFPPLIPTGKYMVEALHMYLSREVLLTKTYGEVVRPIV